MQRKSVHSGFAILLGRPSSGKSTLVNALCGHKVSIVSSTPQTTRNTIRGIVNRPGAQIVLLDTPGMHVSEQRLNIHLKRVVEEAIPEGDLLLYLIDPSRPPGEEERAIADLATRVSVPVIVVVTKTDHPDADVEGAGDFLKKRGLADRPRVEIGGLAGGEGSTGLETLVDTMIGLLPEGDPWYPDDYYTDQPPRFRISEIVREAAIVRTREEVPHAIYVEVADLEQNEKRLWARVFIYVERESQQGILVGKKGSTITAIRESAERTLSQLFPVPVKLSVQVKVRPKWRRDEETLKSLIW
nr:GTPase Era [Spirochaetaceae bacterium]